MNRPLAPIVAVMVSVAACGGTPTSPTGFALPPIPRPPTAPTAAAVSPAGNWSGSIREPSVGVGTVRLSLNDTIAPDSLRGTWTATFDDGAVYSGRAISTLSSVGYGILLAVEPPPRCATSSDPGAANVMGFTLINLVVTASRLTAVSGRTSCNAFSFGAFGAVDLSRQ